MDNIEQRWSRLSPIATTPHVFLALVAIPFDWEILATWTSEADRT
jgi:hypothetical protein